jgi:Gluconate 2-dehydrogenase subunit 3
VTRISRRDFVKGASLVPLAAALPGGALARALADTSTHYRFFTAHQGSVIVEATARLIPGPQDDPSETGHPGAREANVVRYIDTMLATFTFHPPRIHAGGPFSNRAGAPRDDMARFIKLPRIRRLGWEKRLKQFHVAYRKGVKELDSLAGGGFASAPPDQQDGALAQASFTPLLFQHAIEGMYSVPEYGGNQGLVGWQDIFFPGDSQPRGYTVKQVSQSDGPSPIAADMAAFFGRHFQRAVQGVRLGRWGKAQRSER